MMSVHDDWISNVHSGTRAHHVTNRTFYSGNVLGVGNGFGIGKRLAISRYTEEEVDVGE